MMSLHFFVLIQGVVFLAMIGLLVINIRQLRKETQNQYTRLANEANTLALISTYLKSIDQQLLLNKDIKQSQVKQSEKSPISYNYAKKIIETGGSIDEVMRGCQLTHGEAQLLSALHGGQEG